MSKPNDAPAWAEVLGLLLPIGVTMRTFVHSVFAEAETYPDHDVTLSSPQGLSGRTALLAAVTSTMEGVILYPSLSYPARLDVGLGFEAIMLWLIANSAVLIFDPVWITVAAMRDHLQETMMHDTTDSDPTYRQLIVLLSGGDR